MAGKQRSFQSEKTLSVIKEENPCHQSADFCSLIFAEQDEMSFLCGNQVYIDSTCVFPCFQCARHLQRYHVVLESIFAPGIPAVPYFSKLGVMQ